MPKRTLARHRALLTLASQPWTLYEAPPGDEGAGGGGGGGATVNEHGYPDATPVADMSAEHQAAYWRYHSKKWEATAKSAPDSAELERLKARDADLKKLEDESLTETQRLQAEKDAAATQAAADKATAEAATRRALVLEIALDKKLTVAQADRLRGATKEELEADADELLKLFGGTGQGGNDGGSGHRVGGPRGGEVGKSGDVKSGAELFRERHGKN